MEMEANKQFQQITMETVASLQFTGPCQRKNCKSCFKKTKQSDLSSARSFFSDILDQSNESVKVHPDCEDVEEDCGKWEEEVKLGEKCLKWIQDVQEEKSKNPEKMFLPHQLIP